MFTQTLFVYGMMAAFVCMSGFYMVRKMFTPLRAFLLGGVFLGLAGMVALTPWSIPDGGNHFWSAYDRVESLLDGGNGGLMRASDGSAYDACYCDRPGRADYEAYWAIRNQTVEETLVENPHRMPELAFYQDINYAPMMFGILLARLLHLNFFYMTMLARGCQWLVVFALYAYAVYRIPVGKWIVALAGMLPLMIQTISGFSYDGMVVAISVNFIASALWLWRKPEGGSPYVHTLVFAALLGLIKGGGYLLLLPLALLCFTPSSECSTGKKILQFVSILLVGAASAYCADVVLAPGELFQLGTENGSNYTTAFAYEQPLAYLELLLRTYLEKRAFLFASMTGTVLGFLEEINSVRLMYVATLLMILTEFIARRRDSLSIHRPLPWVEGVALILPVFVAALTIPAMILKDNPVGCSVIEGLQGRYFFPVFGLGLIWLCYLIPVAAKGGKSSCKCLPEQVVAFAFGLLQCYFLHTTFGFFMGR
ncbi:MAG: DUF2142 domain-containing protein [Lachnospiraceae bacterium]|nr:DUF2142 domain-containing protein [Lachnospiraceae bacterium]